MPEFPAAESFAAIAERWRPGPAVTVRRLDPIPVRAFAGLLDQPADFAAGDRLPPLWHWFHFTPTAARGELGEDGHPLAGRFLPPFPDRRRMMAGGGIVLHAPLTLGEECTRESTLGPVTVKQGRSGEMLFTTVHHELRIAGRTVAEETEQVVYRRQAAGDRRGADQRSGDQRAASAPADQPDGQVPPTSAVSLRCDPVVLFRFSALTYNAHRIHYDRPYATGVEGYPQLVVHGPLLALLMLELPRRSGHEVRRFSYRLRRPLFSGSTAMVTADGSAQDGLRLAVGSRDVPNAATATLTLR